MDRESNEATATTRAPIMQSAGMRKVEQLLRLVGDKDVIVTFTGESGTGKEILARRLHQLSRRHEGPFVPINCAAIPEALFESELFGHERGAFTGASEWVKGKIEAAAGGTLFLDEIGEMPLMVQTKLLHFLETRRFMRVGGSTKISVDVRLVSATLRPIEEDVRAGRFRADLFYRIEGMTIAVPPLRERMADIAPLAREFIVELSDRHGIRPPHLTRAALAALHTYPWPGNVRELRNLIERLCVLRQGKRVSVRDLPEKVQRTTTTLPTEKQGDLVRDPEVMSIRLDAPLNDTIDSILQAALELEGGNRSRAARRLHVSLRTIQRYALRSGITPSRSARTSKTDGGSGR